MSEQKLDYDRQEPHAGRISWVVMVTTFALVMASWSAWWIYRDYKTKQVNAKEITPLSDERRQLRIYEDEMLTSYKWMDSKKGVVRIPIDKAIDKVIESYNR